MPSWLRFFGTSALLRCSLLVLSSAMSSSLIPALASANEICGAIAEASIIGQDPENSFLGKITNSFDADSIFNDYGKYGNDFSSQSIWNEFSKFGNNFNYYSPFNENSIKPPILIKNGKIIGYLTTNSSVTPSISPILLKNLCKRTF